jgi:hypothetical protein
MVKADRRVKAVPKQAIRERVTKRPLVLSRFRGEKSLRQPFRYPQNEQAITKVEQRIAMNTP